MCDQISTVQHAGDDRRSAMRVTIQPANGSAAEQAADVTADREFSRGRNGSSRLSRIDRPEAGLPRVDPAGAQDHDAGAHQPEHRARRATV